MMELKMIKLVLLIGGLTPYISAAVHSDWVNALDDEENQRDQAIKDLQANFDLLARQLMLQQFFVEEKIRSDGNSGIKQIRIRSTGTKNYFSPHHAGGSMAAIHDHSNNIRTVGMGEFVAVLNGVEFRTRHNDYRLYMPHPTSKQWHATEPIPFPDVPMEVRMKKTVADQITEMREWFKAWATQNTTHRDYRKYFKPILCYLEGAWTHSRKELDEPFNSDRHFVDAKNWQDLQARVQFTSYTGSKNRLENLAFLPTTIIGMNGSKPIFAQWNYRILCSPLKKDVPFNRLHPVDDISTRMRSRRTMPSHVQSRAARFVINSKDQDTFFERPNQYGFLDELMESIPGKNNHDGRMEEHGVDGDDKIMDMDGVTVKDVSKYHRWYKLQKKDAMGVQAVKRGYSDSTVFMAMTNQHNVAGRSVEDRVRCKKEKMAQNCKYRITQKWSYAIPLELIYLTPLSSWNPYNLPYRGQSKTPLGKTVTAGGRTGRCNSPEKAYNGTNSKIYYVTPAEFYSGTEHHPDAADTAGKAASCVKDANGKIHKVRSTGTRIFFPPIHGIDGAIRQRYPIMPVHSEGSPVWKELNAYKDAALNPDKYPGMLSETSTMPKPTKPPVPISDVELVTELSRSNVVGPHVHTITLDQAAVAALKSGKTVDVSTSHANGHSHSMKLRYNRRKDRYFYILCGGVKTCRDGHPRNLKVVVNDSNAEV